MEDKSATPVEPFQHQDHENFAGSDEYYSLYLLNLITFKKIPWIKKKLAILKPKVDEKKRIHTSSLK